MTFGRVGEDMTRIERLAYRWSIGLGIAFATIAAVATRAAADNDAIRSALNVLVASAPFIPARHWSQGSDFPGLTAIYFFLAWPVFPAVVGALAAGLWTQDPNERFTSGFELKAGFSGLLMLALGPGSLWAMDGAEMLGTPIGAHLSYLVLFGWAHFAIAGFITGLGVVALRRVFGPTRIR
ncbi:hypothetical protein [Luteibacter sp.]|uniref:hypothetical protein n=1 Tax=Luteibacter sp. TaxID=1886636 RepID=UPI003F7F2E1F